MTTGNQGASRESQVLFVTIVASVLCLLGFVAFSSEAPRPSAGSSPSLRDSSPFDELKRTYAEIRTLEAKFSQTIFIASLKKERQSKGEFFFKRHKGFLWRYSSPKIQYFLYDGKFIWQGDEDKPFVTKDRIDKEKTGGTFFDLVEDIAKIDELFSIKEHTIERDSEVLELIPKKEGTVIAAKVWIGREKRIRKIEIREFTGNINTLEFSAIKVNQAVDDGKFVFKHDGKKEIIER